ncbi:MAG: glycosyltransferase family 4 protein [Alicyclobacillaceae bacterium]|nr:glycosyltransferase family 4 protein [Alicyclobacillaceae bacterium]
MKVGLLTHSFVDGYNRRFDRMFGGGLERYLYDLCALLRDMGVQPEVHQLSFFGPFRSTVEGIDVFGHPCTEETSVEVFQEMASVVDGPVIYASFIWHRMRYRPGSIGICHGINWDRCDLPSEAKKEVAAAVQGAVDQLDRIVSVDSHFLSYCRSVCVFEDPDKIVLLPNAVDTARFRPNPRMRERDRVRVLYPRRISWERGVIPMMLIADRLLDRYPEVVVEFAGEVVEGHPVSRAFFLWMKDHPHRRRIEHRVLSFWEMAEAYQRADIAVIPSLFSEGTAYGCLEALSCGAAVVAANVGGLNDLIVDGYNGLLVPPDADALLHAVERCVRDARLRRSLGRRGRETALAFDRHRWRARWQRVLEEWWEGPGLAGG